MPLMTGAASMMTLRPNWACKATSVQYLNKGCSVKIAKVQAVLALASHFNLQVLTLASGIHLISCTSKEVCSKSEGTLQKIAQIASTPDMYYSRILQYCPS